MPVIQFMMPQKQRYAEEPSHSDRIPDPRLNEITHTLRERLRGVCADMSEPDFEGLICEMAKRERAWELQANRPRHSFAAPRKSAD